MSQINYLGEDDQGNPGSPGSQANEKSAGVLRIRHGYELHVRHRWGCNQGYMQWHGCKERKFRANSLDELMRVGISELRNDEDFEESSFTQAVRNAIFSAQDAEDAEEEERPTPHDAALKIADAVELMIQAIAGVAAPEIRQDADKIKLVAIFEQIIEGK